MDKPACARQSRRMGVLNSMRVVGIAGVVLLGAVPSVAQTSASPPTQTLSLTPEEKADILAHQTEESVDAARAGLPGGGGARQIHGEIGAAIGTHGARDAYGVAAIPLGDHAGATVSFEDSRTPSRR
jgi:hypothetical protein